MRRKTFRSRNSDGSRTTMISVKNLSKSFGNFVAVNDLSFDVNPGDIVGFLGPNGAGKSTTMKMLTGNPGGELGSTSWPPLIQDR